MRLPTVLLASLLCATQAASGAENWPGTKALKFEVVGAAGGLPDIVPRELSNYLSASIGVPVVVENRPGAGGNIAAGVVAKADPDGHTLLVTGTNVAVNPTLLPNPGFDYGRDLVPVSMTVVAKMLLVASPTFPVQNIADVIALAKQKPKSVSIAIQPIGSPNNLAAEMLAQYGNIDLDLCALRGHRAVPAGRVGKPRGLGGRRHVVAATAHPQGGIESTRRAVAATISTSAGHTDFGGSGIAKNADRFVDLHHGDRRNAAADYRAPRRRDRQSSRLAGGPQCLRQAGSRNLPHGTAAARRIYSLGRRAISAACSRIRKPKPRRSNGRGLVTPPDPCQTFDSSTRGDRPILKRCRRPLHESVPFAERPWRRPAKYRSRLIRRPGI